MATDVQQFVEGLNRYMAGSGQVVHLESIPARPSHLQDPSPPLPPELSRALASGGVRRLYSHQARALELVRAGRDVVAATPTASGKSLVYALPLLERLLAEPTAKSLLLFPLKALEQDQMAALNGLAAMAGLGAPAAIYDGDTPAGLRQKLKKDPPPLLITNPDMLHMGFCAFPEAWHQLLANLKYIVIDEVHTYRGVFGSQFAQVLKRLLRLARAAGSRPQFILCSATVANPAEHAAALTGRPFGPDQVVDQTGAPAAGRHFALVEPAGAASTCASRLLARAVKKGLATICFTKSRLHTELIHSWVGRSHPELKRAVAGYRAGFLPEERRKIERDLASGRLGGVVTTSALEMGIDIGGLDLCILVGYPGSIINTWQRGGRVGRGDRESLVVLVAENDALDAYFLRHPEKFFGRPVEAAIVDPDNKRIVAPHLVCAAAEAPLGPDEGYFDLARHAEVLQELLATGELLEDAAGGSYFSSRKRPQRFVNIRGTGDSFTIVGPDGKVIGSLDGVRAFKEGYPGAVYLHQTRSFLSRHLDLEHKKVTVNPVKVDYFTRARSEKETEILEETGRRPAGAFLVHQGRLRVTERVVGFERRRISGGERLGVYPLELPPLVFETHGLWMDIEAGARRLVEKAGRHFMGSIHALEHAGIGLFPLFALCDRNDLGGISIPMHPQTGKAAVFIYDGAPGGVGLAERGFEVIEGILQGVEELLSECECEDGCPACIHSPKCGSGNVPLDKQGALLLTRALLGKEVLEDDGAQEPVPIIGLEEPLVEPREKPLRFGVFDLETQKLASEVGGWNNAHLMRVSVAVLYLSETDRFEVFWERDMPRLVERLSGLELVMGFNNRRFDNKVLSAYTSRDLDRLPTLDLMQEVTGVFGHRLSLEALAGATLGAGKSADGLQAVEWWRQGNLKDLAAYCQRDVEATRDLFLFGQREGHLLFTRKDGNKVRVPLDWSWPALRERFAK